MVFIDNISDTGPKSNLDYNRIFNTYIFTKTA